jgi:hypothetical protein
MAQELVNELERLLSVRNVWHGCLQCSTVNCIGVKTRIRDTGAIRTCLAGCGPRILATVPGAGRGR